MFLRTRESLSSKLKRTMKTTLHVTEPKRNYLICTSAFYVINLFELCYKTPAEALTF